MSWKPKVLIKTVAGQHYDRMQALDIERPLLTVSDVGQDLYCGTLALYAATMIVA